jgi:hypothetical protein
MPINPDVMMLDDGESGGRKRAAAPAPTPVATPPKTIVATTPSTTVAAATAAGKSGDYSNLNKIIKDPEAYEAFKDARAERIKADRIASTPPKKSVPQPLAAPVQVPTPAPSTPGPSAASVSPTPVTPSSVSPAAAVAPTTPTAPVKVAPIDTILFDDSLVSEDFMFDLIFENIGGHELINIARNDIVNGQTVSYQPIKNLTSIQEQYNPNNIISLQETSGKYFDNYAIKFENKIPNIGNGPFGNNVYLNNLTGDILIDLINLEPDEQVEVQIVISGTIYTTDFQEGVS